MGNRFDRLGATLLLFSMLGCAEENRPEVVPPASSPPADFASAFDAAATGTLKGRIVWAGPIPVIPPLEVYPDLNGQPDLPGRGSRPNPHVPRVHEQTRGVGQAVIFLRHVDVRKSRPWHHEAVRVEQDDWRLSVHQGSSTSAIGFVRRGDAFQAVSKQKVLHILHGEGADFFSLPFPDPNVISTRHLNRVGHVDLSSGADYYWTRAHLFVDDHPYYTLSDTSGQFVLPLIPAGTYQVVCWLPNWRVKWLERDAESGVRGRIGYHAPLAKELTVAVPAGGTATVDFTVADQDFAR